MKTRFAIFLSALILLLAACAPAATPPPTAIPTSTPTLTPTITPTATPNATATQAAKATQQMEQAVTKVKSELEALDISTDTGELAYYDPTAVLVPLTGHYQYLAVPINEGKSLTAADFVLSTDITWHSPGLSTCGIVFRSEPNLKSGAQYLLELLRLSGLPAWSISYMEDAKFQNSPSGSRTSSAIDQSDGGKNHVVLVAREGKFTLYINEVRQGNYYDYSEQRLDGHFGFYAWQDTGSTTCTFENTAIWIYK